MPQVQVLGVSVGGDAAFHSLGGFGGSKLRVSPWVLFLSSGRGFLGFGSVLCQFRCLGFRV